MEHSFSTVSQTCSWQCQCTISATIGFIRMPQFRLGSNIIELSPTKSEMYWRASVDYLFNSQIRCHVEEITEKFLSRVNLRAAASSTGPPSGRQSWNKLESLYHSSEWMIHYGAIAIVERVFGVQKDLLSMKKLCNCRRHFRNWHRYLPGYCYEGHLQSNPVSSTNPTQEVAMNNQQTCDWQPTMIPEDGNTIQPSSSAQLPTDPNHYMQAQHNAAAAGSGHELSELEQQLQDYLWLSENRNFVSNDYGLPDNLMPDPMTYIPYPNQCLANTDSFSAYYHNYYDQCQVHQSHGESSWQVPPSQQYDYTANQHTHAQADQFCDPNMPYLPALYDQDGRYVGPGSGPMI